MSQIGSFTTLVALILGTWLIALIVGVVLIRDSRPYSASLTGRLVAGLGIVIVLVSLTALVMLTRLLAADFSSASYDTGATTSVLSGEGEGR